MKKNTILLTSLLCASLFLSACNTINSQLHSPGTTTDISIKGPSTPETDPTVSENDPTASTDPESTEPNPTDPKTGLPVYVPGSVQITDMSDIFPFDRQYRYCFYSFKGPWQSLLSEEQKEDFYAWQEEFKVETNYGEFQNEMLLVSIIKRYNIPREAFDAALEKYIASRSVSELKTEFWEAPNADILYTFDNEIINEYYRYE